MVRLFGPAGKGLMLFKSYPFIFLFLPAVLLVGLAVRGFVRRDVRAA